MKIYSELGLEALNYVFYEVLNSTSPKFLSDITPRTTRRYASRYTNNIPLVRVSDNYFMNTFFPSRTTEWDKLDRSIQNSASLNIIKDRLSQSVRPSENSV